MTEQLSEDQSHYLLQICQRLERAGITSDSIENLIDLIFTDIEVTGWLPEDYSSGRHRDSTSIVILQGATLCFLSVRHFPNGGTATTLLFNCSASDNFFEYNLDSHFYSRLVDVHFK